MNNKRILWSLFTIFVLFLNSCNANPLQPEARLWGDWKITSSGHYNTFLASDLTFVQDGTLVVTNNTSLQNTPLTFAIISPGRLKITGAEQPILVNYEVTDESLKIYFNQDTYVYQNASLMSANATPEDVETEQPVTQGNETNPPEIQATESENPVAQEVETQPSEYFLSLPEPIKIIEKSNSTWQMYGSSGSAKTMVEYNGVIWSAGYGGLTAWDKITGQFKHYTRFDGLLSNEVNSIIVSEQDNSIWVGFDEAGIAKFNGREWIPIESEGLEKIIGVTSDGSIWASHHNRIGRYVNGSWEVYDSWNGFVEGANELISQTIGHNGDLWIKTTNINDEPIVLLYHEGYWRTFNINLPDQFFDLLGPASDNEVWLLSADELVLYDGAKRTRVATIPSRQVGRPCAISTLSDYTLVFSTFQGMNSENGYTGLLYLKNKKIEVLDIDKGLPTNNVSDTYFDSDGNLWISTRDGIAMFTGESWRSYTGSNSPSLGSRINDIEISTDNSVWLSSHGGGLSTLKDNLWASYRYGEGPSSDYLYGLDIANDGSIWIGTWVTGEVNHFSTGRWKIYSSAESLVPNNISTLSNIIREIEQASDGKIWAGTQTNGVAVFDGTLWQTTIVNNDTSFRYIRSLATSPNGYVWIGGYDSKNGAKIARLTDEKWKLFDKQSGLTAGDYVNALDISPTGIVYAGTENGLFRFTNGRWEALGGPKHINDIAFEGNGSVWVASDYGISHYKGGQWIESYTLADGLPSNRSYAIEVAPDGSIWVGGAGGVIRIIPKK
jgi:hypothetical protein